MVFGVGAFGWKLSHEDEALMNGISAPTKGTPESFRTLPPSCEDTKRRWHSAARKRVSPGPTMLAPQSQTSGLQHCEEQIFVIYKPPNRDNLLQQPEGTQITVLWPNGFNNHSLIMQVHTFALSFHPLRLE